MLIIFHSSLLLGQNITLYWNPNQNPDVAGYKVYYGRNPRTYSDCIVVGLVTEYVFSNLSDSNNTYFALTAYDTAGNESDYSNEVHITFQEIFSNFKLQENFPNPFNPVTQIPFILFESTPVFLAVYDLLGRQVKILTKENLTAGSYIYSWDGTNKDGNMVSNGVYFCRLIVGEFCQTQKLVLSR